MTYKEFLENKIDIAPLSGIEIDPSEINPVLKPHQRTSVLWALRGGRRGIFARFGLGKTAMQLEWCNQLQKHEGGQTLIVMPLNVMPEFRADAVNLLRIPRSPYPDGDKNILACPNCGSGEYLHNQDEAENTCCGKCGQAIKWED